MEHAKHEEFDVMPRSVDDVPAGQERQGGKLEGGWDASEEVWTDMGQERVRWLSRTHPALDGALEILVV